MAGFDSVFNMLNEVTQENEDESFGDIIHNASNQAMSYEDYQAILQGESDKTTAKFRGLSYEKDWCSVTDRAWGDFPGHQSGMVYVCPELTVLWPLIRKETNADRASDTIRAWLRNNVVDAVKGVKPDVTKVIRVDTTKVPKEMWFCSTLKGINLRPGIMANSSGDGHDPERTEPLHLDDMNPHGLIAGRTGAGKSVTLNTIIASLMEEYSPWEININLADFKIVEMSRYGQVGYEAPHVSKIAATEAMEYVVSVLYEMYSSMAIRQQFFGAIGVQNIKDFRNKFKVVLPHVVILVDEFQQMYELASGKQEDKINQLIKMITKLGRATGYHLLFASQSMSGTLSGDVQANFKMRVCLPASADVSSAVLGNAEASKLVGKGYCYSNCEGGALDANIKYRVPFLRAEMENENDLTDLQKILKRCKDLAEEVGFVRPMNFFRDSAIRPMHGPSDDVRTFEEDIESFRQGTKMAVEKDQEIDDIILLGDSYVYMEPKGKNLDVTLDYFKEKIGDRKNIICIGDSPYQRAYMTELLAMQYAYRGAHNQNRVVRADSVMDSIYDINVSLESQGSPKAMELLPKDFIPRYLTDYSTRNIINDYVQFLMSESKKMESMRATPEECDKKLLDLIVDAKFTGEAFKEYAQNNPDDWSLEKPMSATEFKDKFYKLIIGECDIDGKPIIPQYTELTYGESKWLEDATFSSLAEKFEQSVDEDFKTKMRDEGEFDAEFNSQKEQLLEIKYSTLFYAVNQIAGVYNAIKNMYVSGVKNGKFSFKNMDTITYWILGYNNVSPIAGERSQAGKLEPFLRNGTNYGIRAIFVGAAVRDISELTKDFGYVLIQSSNEANYSKFDMVMSKEFKDTVLRFKAVGEVVSDVKPHLYPVPNDEKMVKTFDVDYIETEGDDFFEYFM